MTDTPSSPPRAPSSEARLARWQQNLLPWMIAGIVFVALFFFVASLLQFNTLRREMRPPVTTLASQLEPFDRAMENVNRVTAGAQAPDLVVLATQLQYAEWKTRALLEQEAMERRYQLLHALMLMKAWTRYLGFLTGMILALVGSIFILGRLREEATTLDAKGAHLSLALSTASPGIVLSVLGVLLMSITLTVPFDYRMVDRPVYLTGSRALAEHSTVAPWPDDLADVEQGAEAHALAAPAAPAVPPGTAPQGTRP